MSLEEHPGEYEIVVPSVSILCQPTVALVDEVVDDRGTREVATEYLEYLYSTEAQKLEAARKSTVEFIARISAAYQAQAKALVELAKAEKLVQPAQAQESKVDDKTAKIAKPAADAKETTPEKADAPEEDSTRKFDFGELKFGAEYDPKKAK